MLAACRLSSRLVRNLSCLQLVPFAIYLFAVRLSPSIWVLTNTLINETRSLAGSMRPGWVGLVLGRDFNSRGMETCRGSIPPSRCLFGDPSAHQCLCIKATYHVTLHILWHRSAELYTEAKKSTWNLPATLAPDINTNSFHDSSFISWPVASGFCGQSNSNFSYCTEARPT